MIQRERLERDFFIREDVLQIAQDLLGKVLTTYFDGQYCSGIITETEAYRAPEDKASHAYGNRRSARTEVMFREGGCAYVYLCYGIHHLFNVVTGKEDMAHAVLIRAIEPLDGIETMQLRRYATGIPRGGVKPALTTGPGVLSQALGIQTQYTGQSLTDRQSPIWLETNGLDLKPGEIESGPRIGVDYAAECAEWPWRFWIRGTRFRK